MKDELLDIDAILSCAVAELSMPTPDIAEALARLSEARAKILDMAEALESPRNN